MSGQQPIDEDSKDGNDVDTLTANSNSNSNNNNDNANYYNDAPFMWMATTHANDPAVDAKYNAAPDVKNDAAPDEDANDAGTLTAGYADNKVDTVNANEATNEADNPTVSNTHKTHRTG